MIRKVMEHQIRKGYSCGKIYLPKEFIDKKVEVKVKVVNKE